MANKKPTVLIAEADADLLDIYQIIIEGKFDCQVLCASTGSEAIDYIQNEGQIDCIISDYKMPNKSGGDLFQANRLKNNVPFTLISGGFYSEFQKLEGFEPNGKNHIYLEKPITEEKVVESIRSMLSVRGSENFENEDKSYSKIHLKFLMDQSAPGDIYLKLAKDKFTKIVNSGEACDEILQKYIDKNEEFGYLKIEDFKSYIKSKVLELFDELSAANTQEEAIESSAHMINSLEMGLEVLGIRQEHIQLIEKSVDNCLTYLKQDESLESLLKLNFTEDGYLVSHSLLALHVSYLICSRMSLSDKEFTNKLAYAAILHDLAIGSDELSEIMILNQDVLDALPLEKRITTRNHIQEILSHLQNLDQIPSDTLKIISEHHEHPNNNGYPRNSGANNISPLSGIFVLSLKISDFILKCDLHENSLDELKDELEKDYFSGKFKSPCQTFFEYIGRS